MATRDELIAHCDELLDIESFEDYGPNGLQVPGVLEVSTVATAVSASLATLRGAVEAEAQLLLVHHGLFWEFMPRALSPQMAERMRVLLDSGLSLAGYHLPLDAHPQVGNNALLCGLLGFQPAERFGEAKGRAIGFVGRRDEPIPIGELQALIESELDRRPLLQGAGPERVGSVGVVSGAGSDSIREAVGLGLDAVLTGEPAEHAMADAFEGGLHFIAAGHYATETFGIRKLGERLVERFGVEHRFIDVPNPV
jgi:dinuclear metal center YbgI/SA1388 family protein